MIIMLIIIGFVLGRFYNVCIYLISRTDPNLFASSCCPWCNQLLKPKDLITTLNFINLKGSCRYCGSKVSVYYPLVEIITALTVLLLYWRYGLTERFFVYIVLASLLIIISFIDLKKQIIPNIFIIVGMIMGIFFSLLDFSVTLTNAVLGLLLGSGLLLLVELLSLLVFKKEGIGSGDIILMGMIGLFLGWKTTLLSLLLSIYFGGIISMFLLITSRKMPGEYIPFGPFIGCGTLVALIWGKAILSWYTAYLFGG